MLGQLLPADPGHRGPRLPCGQGHEAEFADCRDKVIDTVLGPVTLESLVKRAVDDGLMTEPPDWPTLLPPNQYA